MLSLNGIARWQEAYRKLKRFLYPIYYPEPSYDLCIYCIIRKRI